MFQSILDDIKQSFRIGTMVNKLIMVNAVIFVPIFLLHAFKNLYPFELIFNGNLSISANPAIFLLKPWTFISHMFVHYDFFHILFNMLVLNIFGNIVGDLLGDRRVLPLYIFGGLVSALFFIVSSLLREIPSSTAIGASGSIMAFVMTAALVAPNYEVRLLLIGDVKIKYIAFVLILLNIASTQAILNSGGAYGHLGGLVAGVAFVSLYKKGIDVLNPFEKLFNYLSSLGFSNRKKMKIDDFKRRAIPAKEMSNYRSGNSKESSTHSSSSLNFQERLDNILDKINEKGYDKLSQEEKEFLKEASNKNI